MEASAYNGQQLMQLKLARVLRISDCRMLNLKLDIYITPSSSGSISGGRRKTCRKLEDRKECCVMQYCGHAMAFVPGNSQQLWLLDKTNPINMSSWMEKGPQESHFSMRSYGQRMVAEEGVLFLSNKATDW